MSRVYLSKGILLRALVRFVMSGRSWGQTGPNLSATLTSCQWEGVKGGMKRSEAAGAEAYGIPKYPSTSLGILPDLGIMIPRTLPYAVFTTLVLLPRPHMPKRMRENPQRVSRKRNRWRKKDHRIQKLLYNDIDV